MRAKFPARHVFLLFLLSLPVLAFGVTSDEPSLEHGFTLLYDLQFDSAQREFLAFQQSRPDDPLGPVSEAAGILFAQLNQLGILESQFFVNDEEFRHLRKKEPDAQAKKKFDLALDRGRNVAEKRLLNNPNDHAALLASALNAGLRADYAALIQDRKMDALHYTKEATASAEQLLTVCKDCYDAYVATGISGYLIGSLAAPVRWVLRVGGFSGDKQKGVAQLQLAAEHGHYLAPFARILLAIAYLREGEPEQSRQILVQLHNTFPENDLFVKEIARLDSAHQSSKLRRP